MSQIDSKQLVESYLKWLRKEFSADTLEDACELTTPFLDRHNDHLQIYARNNGNGTIALSDDGNTLMELKVGGLETITKKVRGQVQLMLNAYGAKLVDEDITIRANKRNLGQQMHYLIQAILAVNDMYALSPPTTRIADTFQSTVSKFFKSQKFVYMTKVKLPGKSGYSHAIDFAFPSINGSPERVLKVINSPSKNSITNYIFALQDSRDGRDEEAEAYALFNDINRSVSSNVLDALEAYDVKSAYWSQRNGFAKFLAA